MAKFTEQLDITDVRNHWSNDECVNSSVSPSSDVLNQLRAVTWRITTEAAHPAAAETWRHLPGIRNEALCRLQLRIDPARRLPPAAAVCMLQCLHNDIVTVRGRAVINEHFHVESATILTRSECVVLNRHSLLCAFIHPRAKIYCTVEMSCHRSEINAFTPCLGYGLLQGLLSPYVPA